MLLKRACIGCGSQSDLYGSSCKHMTLCMKCGKTMAENKAKCPDCGTLVTRLIREYNVRASAPTDKSYFIGKFVTGLPNFNKNNNWSLRKDIPQGRQFTDAKQREKYLKKKDWTLEDKSGEFQFEGRHVEGSQCATYYLLVMEKKDFLAIPVGSWCNFNKVVKYKQLTLEEAEEKMKNRRKTADGYERWMMKGTMEKFDNKESGGSGRKKASCTDGEEVSDKKSNDDDDEEGPRGGDVDMDDDDEIEKGDEWEHEEIFTDDDEEVGNDLEEREDEIPVPQEIKQDEEIEDEEGRLSKSGIELKKLLGRSSGLNESESEDDHHSDEDATKEERTPPKAAPVGSSPSSKPSKGKRKLEDDSSSSTQKKVKTEHEPKSLTNAVSSVKGEPSSASSATGRVTEEEIRSFLMENKQVTLPVLVSKFRARLQTKEDKDAFSDIVKNITKLKKNQGSQSFVVLADK